MQQQSSVSRPPDQVLLATAASGGAIAAARQLARTGVHVGVLASEPLSAASWSRCVSKVYRGPREKQGRRLLDRLVAIGAARPGQVLLPTSDETAWLYACNASTLGAYFRMHLPSTQTMQRLMDKHLLSQAALEAGLAVLPTWEIASYQELVGLAPALPYPILIKPRTQVHRVRNDKGAVAHNSADLLATYRKFLSQEQTTCQSPGLPGAGNPLLQHFVDLGSEGVHSLSGFIDESGELFVSRHARKILQRSQPAGVGICFESLPPNPELTAAARRLCRELGYFGIFEIEFIRFDERWAVIDFNPRLFNQVGMDAHRGMPLPLMAYLDAAGRRAELKALVAQSQEANHHAPAVFYDRFTLCALLAAKTLTGRASSGELSYWRRWMRQHAGHSVDFAFEPLDPMPGLIHALSEVLLGILAFRKFLRSTTRTRSAAPRLIARVLP